MVEVKGIKKSFGGTEVLKGVDIKVEQGDVVAILGPSGSGKTTLLRCMNFLERAQAGQLVFDGQAYDLHKVTKKEIAAIRRKTAFVFQNYNLFLNKTALQNVTEGLVIARKMPKDQARQTAEQALEKVGLSDRMDYYPSQLSGGQQQRVAIARALAAGSELILADEPTGNLDEENSQLILDILRRLAREQGRSIVVVTHDPVAAEYASVVFRMRDGHLLEDPGAQEGRA